ncbi:hypothetical protein CEF21_15730 [Bacillus sp. FJAT-42376]|uniref:hypothetical protein n=1 Tax=Bacillus sp. FJAT-42376 TaxID=2014076 RepID=UPI000F4F6398|nr:hypothetical protein [Bacillus sp. FJAT-42376]AZB43641.1 hypothetical protein CEF21_15730 [Bacillus sp. FJAT-42376]
MKRLILLCSIALLAYIIYYDLRIGTIPANETDTLIVSAQPAGKESFKKLNVRKGESVLIMINKVNGNSIPVPLETAVKDFEKLNPGTKANRILTGHSYKFPVYE